MKVSDSEGVKMKLNVKISNETLWRDFNGEKKMKMSGKMKI